jgi:hypothetical protein
MRRLEIDLLQRDFDRFYPPKEQPEDPQDDLDLLPEFCHYQDEGCRFSPSCLDCPLPECVEDGPGAERKFSKSKRNAAVARLHFEQKKTFPELAGLFGIEESTVRKIVEKSLQSTAGGENTAAKKSQTKTPKPQAKKHISAK